ncbi:MAG TPA: crossover junction endodeoxyribonuclease RuvC [Candidatus Paceibacterota bacterium]|nr:crossover junction endodeoxyribonuclease RuvC [Candidatus Paceibacterota bacterium]
MKILGIDPGYERLGIAILEKNKTDRRENLLFSECFKTSAKLEFSERILLIGERLEEIIKKYKPEVLSIETLFFTTNQKTAMHVAETRGVIIYLAKKYNLKIFEATPLQIKIATTGYGKATKDQVMKMVKMLIQVDKNKKSDDELDAIAITLTASAHLRF